MTRKAIPKGCSEPIQDWSIDFEVRRLAYTGLVLLLLYSSGPAAKAQEPFEAANHAAPINASDKLDYACAHSGVNPAFNGNQGLSESAPVVKPSGDPAKTLRWVGNPIRAFSRLSDRFTSYTEGGSNSWHQWPIRLLMESADQFQLSIPSRPHRSVLRPIATTAARH